MKKICLAAMAILLLLTGCAHREETVEETSEPSQTVAETTQLPQDEETLAVEAQATQPQSPITDNGMQVTASVQDAGSQIRLTTTVPAVGTTTRQESTPSQAANTNAKKPATTGKNPSITEANPATKASVPSTGAGSTSETKPTTSASGSGGSVSTGTTAADTTAAGESTTSTTKSDLTLPTADSNKDRFELPAIPLTQG